MDDPLSDAAINESISSVLNHCGDWEGGRNERKQTSKKETSAANERLDARYSPDKKKPLNKKMMLKNQARMINIR